MAWESTRFVWAELREKAQAEDFDFDGEWEKAAAEYDAFLKSQTWESGIQKYLEEAVLHDAALLDIYEQPGKVALTYRQSDGAWDPRKYIAAVQYLGVVEVGNVSLGYLVGGCFEYDQFAVEGEYYRHWLLIDGTAVSVKFKEMKMEKIYI